MQELGSSYLYKAAPLIHYSAERLESEHWSRVDDSLHLDMSVQNLTLFSGEIRLRFPWHQECQDCLTLFVELHWYLLKNDKFPFSYWYYKKEQTLDQHFDESNLKL